MNFKDMQQIADAAMSKILINAGFLHTAAGIWNRRRGEELNVIQLQEHSSGKTFCVNLGIHYIFLPKSGTQTSLDDCDQIEVPDCEMMIRLTDQTAAKDQWWAISASSAEQIAELVSSRGLMIFDSYRLDGPILEIDGNSIQSGNLGVLAPLTKIRACLLLARIHERMGNREKCVEAATIGLKLAGLAVGPKKELSDILKRLVQ